MAAAGAAHYGAQVMIVDRLHAPLGLQRNNRQRFIHPFVYDWPSFDSTKDEALLPFFPWRAGYAEDVVSQIERGWERLLAAHRRRIRRAYGVKDVRVSRSDGKLHLSWSAPSQNFDPFECDILILAVGFGLEPEEHPWEQSLLGR